jgi:pSer/pThr/pTyr-binding forkhead associated (FHA) protein
VLVTFAEFARDHAGQSREDFLEEVREPHLVIPNLAAGGGGDEPTSFATMRFTPGVGAKSTTKDSTMVIPVRKRRDSNAFAMMITLGRAPNNDLVIPDQRVSKFHAYFRKLGQQWMINDANSMNGTWVDGTLIPSDRSAALKSGSRIRLAETLELQFLEPADLFARLQAK